MKISIYVCGQIAAGKAAFAKQLSEKLNISVFSTHNFLESSKQDDSSAWSKIINLLDTLDEYIFVSTGLSKRMDKLIRNDLKNGRIIFVIKLLCSKSTALERVKKREAYIKWSYEISIEESIEWIEKELNKIDADLEFDMESTDTIDAVELALKKIGDLVNEHNRNSN
ncbi:hypothetical protein [Paenibacillus sp. OAS669]|uniref:hypothetical protein n=1 Tax=Paenibacillus sp. OAS669 TaxID=2663821 RepID=UPI0017891D66|nr:hypothetical protein [Paenibacillus sp. OAS669]MBE1446142.1 adenylate kinase family enzyme [Paenibacillus sp. OAS669]